MLSDIEGLVIPPVIEGATHAFWRYSVSMDKDVFSYDVTQITERLKAKGIYCLARYIQKPAFMCQVLRNKQTYGNSQCPFSCPLGRGSEIAEYNYKDYPGAIDGLSRIIVFPWNKFYTKEHVSYIAHSIKEVLSSLAKEGSKGKL